MEAEDLKMVVPIPIETEDGYIPLGTEDDNGAAKLRAVSVRALWMPARRSLL